MLCADNPRRKNAFNLARWKGIIEALVRLGAVIYLMRIFLEFLMKSEGGSKEYPKTYGIPQGSVLRPLLWDIMYNGVLTLSLSNGVTSI